MSEFFASELGLVLNRGRGTANHLHSRARVWAENLPATHRALSEGELDLARAAALADVLGSTTPDLAGKVEAVLLPEAADLSVARLKAVFFVRDFNGNPRHKEQKTSSARGQGRRLEVTFADGEVITGATLNYRPDGQGFFMSPSDAAANNTRVFVVATALRRVRFL